MPKEQGKALVTVEGAECGLENSGKVRRRSPYLTTINLAIRRIENRA